MSYLDRLLVRTGVEATGLPSFDRAPPAPLEVEATRVVVASSPASLGMPAESALALTADRQSQIEPAAVRSLQPVVSTEVTREVRLESSAMSPPAPAPVSAEPSEVVIEMRPRPPADARSAAGELPRAAAGPLESREPFPIPHPAPEVAASPPPSPSLTLVDVRRWVSQTPDPAERAVVAVDVAGEPRGSVVEPQESTAVTRPAISAWHPLDAPAEVAQAAVQHITVGIGTVELTVEAVPDAAPPPPRNTAPRVAEPEPSFSRLSRRYLRA